MQWYIFIMESFSCGGVHLALATLIFVRPIHTPLEKKFLKVTRAQNDQRQTNLIIVRTFLSFYHGILGLKPSAKYTVTSSQKPPPRKMPMSGCCRSADRHCRGPSPPPKPFEARNPDQSVIARARTRPFFPQENTAGSRDAVWWGGGGGGG